jgi:hypothetical protein
MEGINERSIKDDIFYHKHEEILIANQVWKEYMQDFSLSPLSHF